MLPELLLCGSTPSHCSDPQRFRQAAFAVQVAEATARFLGRCGAAAAAAGAGAAAQTAAGATGTQQAAVEPQRGAAAATAAEEAGGEPHTKEAVSNAITGCVAVCSAALQIGFKLSFQFECGRCTAPAPELGQTLQQLLHAVGSLLGTAAKLQVVNHELELLTCSLATGVDLLHAWHNAAVVDAKLACLQQQQQQQQQQQHTGAGLGGSSKKAAPAALHVVGYHLLLMSNQVQPVAAAAAAAPDTPRVEGAVQLPGWLVGAQAQQRFVLQQQQQEEEEEEEEEVQDLHTFHLVEYVLRELAALVVDEGSSSSSSAAADQDQLRQDLQLALDSVSSLKTWYGQQQQQQQQDGSTAPCDQQQQQQLGTGMGDQQQHRQQQLGKGKGEQQQQQQQQQGAASTPWEALVTLQQSLQQAGEALCAAARCCSCCCNPGCTNLATVSECFALVRGRRCVCAGCLAAQEDTLGATHSPAARWVCRVHLQDVIAYMGLPGCIWYGCFCLLVIA